MIPGGRRESDAAPTPPPIFEDRSTGLVVFGLFHIVVALFFLLGLAFLVAATQLTGSLPQTGGPAMQPGALVGASLVYLLIAAVFATLGVGSMLGRRWARALSLVVGWYWLIVGVLVTVFGLVLWPTLREIMESSLVGMPEGGASAAEASGCAIAIAFIVVFLFGVLAPAAVVLFYRSGHVRATCELKDPTPRWTDSRPLPVLALTLMHLAPVLTVLYLPASNSVTVAFGSVLSGASAYLYTGALALVSVWCAWRLWYLDLRGWWAAVVFWLASGVSGVTVFMGDTQREMYDAMGLPDGHPSVGGPVELPATVMVPMMAVSMLAFLVFLLYTKQFMRASGS